MPTKTVTVLNNTRLCEVNPNRKVLVISNAINNGLDINDEALYDNDIAAYMLPSFAGGGEDARPTLILMKTDGDDVTNAWYCYSALAGFVYVYEGF